MRFIARRKSISRHTTQIQAPNHVLLTSSKSLKRDTVGRGYLACSCLLLGSRNWDGCPLWSGPRCLPSMAVSPGHEGTCVYVQAPWRMTLEQIASLGPKEKLTIGRTEAFREAMVIGGFLSSWFAGGRISTRFTSSLAFSPKLI